MSSFDQEGKRSIEIRGYPGPTGKGVVEDDRRVSGLGIEGRRDAANVPSVAQDEERSHGEEGVLSTVDRAGEIGRNTWDSAAKRDPHNVTLVGVGGEVEI